MTSELWHEITDLFSAAIDLGAHARTALLADRCEGRPDLRAEVESLLLADAHAPGFLETPAVVVTSRPPIDVGARLGAYRLVERIGEGGMAVVFRAIDESGASPREVAVKIAHAGCNDDRLHRERHWLRELRHPHIVSLLDVDGPHLVMELVDGPAITRYCERAVLPLDRRLRLFRDVCAAVQHAHEHGVVHRDLKPANILVTRAGVVKLIDFGVATRVDITGRSSRRRHVQRDEIPVPLTPNYASPEQICGHRVTTASDVYALGVLLYELVTGGRPYEADGLPLDQLRTVVLRTMPKKPTTTTRFVDGRLLRHGDLDAVVLKALHKRPERRYASAGELSADVGRCLS